MLQHRPNVITSNSLCYILSNVILNGRASYEQKRFSENELVDGMAPYTAHVDELVAVTLEELDLDPSESDYKSALKRIESLFDAAEPGTPEGDELESKLHWLKSMRKNTSPFKNCNALLSKKSLNSFLKRKLHF